MEPPRRQERQEDGKSRFEPDAELDGLARAVIGAAIEVHRELGPGFLESSYGNALGVELTAREIPFRREAPVNLLYKGHPIGESRLDFLVGGRLIVELKAVESVNDVHRAQVIAYLKATGHNLGLLINFNVAVLKEGVRRIIYW